MTDPRHLLGERAESLVCDRLRAEGFAIVGRNVRVGRSEIDVIARRGMLLVFCEVRARRRRDFVSPLATIDARKIARIRTAAQRWLVGRAYRGVAIRFDAAGVSFEDDARAEIEYVPGAF